jgi:hypothetical protein
VREYEYEVVKKEIEELIRISYAYDDMKTVKKMKEIVPEFHSLNSPYASLDTQDFSEVAHDATYSHSGTTHDATHSHSPASKPKFTSAMPQPSTAAPSAAAYAPQPKTTNPALSDPDETEPAESVAHSDKDDIFLMNNPNQPGNPDLPDDYHSANP